MDFVTKYKPKTFEEVLGNKDVIESLQAMTIEGNIPHLFFYGPPGTGKSTSVDLIVDSILGKNKKYAFKKINGSKERGIDVVRDIIDPFVKSACVAKVPYKILFIDEADMLTPANQESLRLILEDYSKNCRFIFSCNNKEGVKKAIQSRCASFFFGPINSFDIFDRLRVIAGKEKIVYEEAFIQSFVEQCGGDMRKTLNQFYKFSKLKRPLTVDLLVDLENMERHFTYIITQVMNGNWKKARKEMCEYIVETGVNTRQYLQKFYDNIIQTDIDNIKRAKIIREIAKTDIALREGGNDVIHLDSLLNTVLLIVAEVL